jgi:glycosyltransferase involved in cell wall biosynthesis
MRALFATGSVNFQRPGGAEVAIMKKKRYLAEIGVEAQIFDPTRDKIADFDLVHLYQFSLSNFEIAQFAKKCGIPIFLQPVYWPMDESFREYSYGGYRQLVRYLLRFGRHIPHYTRVQEILPFDPPSLLIGYADVVTVNSKLEENVIRSEFPMSRSFSILPAGVDARFASANPTKFKQSYDIDEFVLTVGNIAPRKNTLRLIRASKLLGLPLVVVGHPFDSAYYKRCMEEAAGTKVLFLTNLDHESELLSSCYSAAKVFALPSWFETPGLSALEAAVSGCRLVVTSRGSTTEYFGEDATYVNPGSVESIIRGLREALSRPRSPDLSDRILKRCRWEAVANSMKSTYESLLTRGSS